MVKHMQDPAQARLLMKILIGVAWLDGQIQPEERQYLTKVARTHDLASEPDISQLLASTTPVTAADLDRSIQAYLGDRSIHEDGDLIEAISGLIYSDGDVATAEARLLTNLQSPPSAAPNSSPLIATIRQLYHNWLQKV